MAREHGYARYRLGPDKDGVEGKGCRCYTCGWARSQYDERRTKMSAAGTWQPFTDLTLVQQHIATLRDIGFGQRQIAALSGVERKTIRDIAAGVRHDPGRGNPPMTKVRTETATKIMAVPLDPLGASDKTYVDATVTWELIDLLIREGGYSKARISAEIGGNGRALQLRRTRVTAANARKIKALFDRVLGDSARTFLEVEAVEDTVLRLREEGLPPSEIGRKVDLPTEEVRRILREEGEAA